MEAELDNIQMEKSGRLMQMDTYKTIDLYLFIMQVYKL
jgi:hypothetical protein